MMWDMILASPLARRYGIYALAALLLVGAVTAWGLQVRALRSERDEALTKLGSVEQEAKQLRSTLEFAQLQIQARQEAETKRAEAQEKITEVKRERSKRNITIMAKAENKPLADMPLTADMLDGLRE